MWVKKLRAVPSLGQCDLLDLIKGAVSRANAEDAALLAAQRAKIRGWASEALAGSCRKGHSYLRKADVTVELPFAQEELEGTLVLDPLRSVDKRRTFWSKWWQRDTGPAGRLERSLAEIKAMAGWDQHRLQPLDDDQVAAALARLRNGRGLGADHWAPLELKSLPAEAVSSLGDLLREIERVCAWPAQTLVNVMCLLPKPSGGERAVVLQAMLMVLWSSARAVHVKTWDAAKGRHWDSALKGNSALKAALMRRLLDELIVQEGGHNINIYWDVEKFYDSVDLVKLLIFAQERGFPLAVAALDLQAHLAMRVLRWCGCHSLPLAVSSSILAGSKFSNSYARLYLYDVLEAMHSELPLQVGQHVDDLAQCARGMVIAQLRRHTVSGALLLSRLLSERGLTISSKSTAVTSARGTLKPLLEELARNGIPCSGELSMRDLGVDASAGRRRATAVASKRLKKGAKRLCRLKVINKIAGGKGRKLYRTNVWPVSSWGISGQGCGPTSIDKMRTHAAAAVLAKGGLCRTSTIALGFNDGADPACAIRERIVLDWLQVWGDADLDLRTRIRAVWHRQLSRLLRSDRWKVVCGPMRAVIASLLDIGWKPARPDCWYEPDGLTQWCFTGSARTSELLASIRVAAMRPLWQRASVDHESPDLAEGFHPWCIKKALNKLERNGKHGEYGALLTIACGATWTACRRHAQGMVGSDLCPRCKLAPETPFHRYYGCRANQDIDHPAVKDSHGLCSWALEEQHRWPSYWCRGLLPKAMILVPPPPEDPLLKLTGSMDDILLAEEVFLDGSGGEFTACKELRRCGWGVGVMKPEDPRLPLAGLCGTLPGTQTVPRAEVYAGYAALYAMATAEGMLWGLVTLVTDNIAFHNGANAPRHVSLASPNNDLWEKYWQAYDAVQAKGRQVRVVKVKSHLTAAKMRLGYETWPRYAGNAFADALAIEGAALNLSTSIPFEVLQDYRLRQKYLPAIRDRITAILMSFKESGFSWFDEGAAQPPGGADVEPALPAATGAQEPPSASAGDPLPVDLVEAACWRRVTGKASPATLGFGAVGRCVFTGLRFRVTGKKDEQAAGWPIFYFESGSHTQPPRGLVPANPAPGQQEGGEAILGPQAGLGDAHVAEHRWFRIPSWLKCRTCLLAVSEADKPVADSRGCALLLPPGRPDRPERLEGPLFLSLRSQVHQSHVLFHYRGLVWCGRCGSYGLSCRAKGLLRECAPPGRYGETALKRVASGLPPDWKQHWLY